MSDVEEHPSLSGFPGFRTYSVTGRDGGYFRIRGVDSTLYGEVNCEKAGILSEVRRREFYEKPTAVRKREKAAAIKRNLKKTSRDRNRLKRLY